MPIRIQCVHCSKSFSAWEDLVGKEVQCPKCHKTMTVPGNLSAGPTSLTSGPLSPAPQRPTQRPAAQNVAAQNPAAQTSTAKRPPAQPTPVQQRPTQHPTANPKPLSTPPQQPIPPANRPPVAPQQPQQVRTPTPPARPPANPNVVPPNTQAPSRNVPPRMPGNAPQDLPLPELYVEDDSDELPTVTNSNRVGGGGFNPQFPTAPMPAPPPQSFNTLSKVAAPTRRVVRPSESLPSACPSCQAPMPAHDDLCNSCGYHKILGKKIDLEGVFRHPKETGAKGWLQDSLGEGESISTIVVWGSLTFGFILVVFGFLFHPWSWLVVLPVLIGGGWYISGRLHLKSMEGDAYQPGAVEKVLWSFMLTIVRVSGYRSPHAPFSALASLVRRDRQFGDESLAATEGLAQVQAIDLEGTAITDASLDTLLELRQLQYLVIRGTQLTPEGALEIQQGLRKTWVWY